MIAKIATSVMDTLFYSSLVGAGLMAVVMMIILFGKAVEMMIV